MILVRKIITFFKIKFSRHWKVEYYEVYPQPNYKEKKKLEKKCKKKRKNKL